MSGVFICYEPHRFSPSSKAIIAKANEIVEEYHRDGQDLTLRQIYYQFVSKGLIPNDQKEYKRLGDILNDARMAGELSWTSMEDRTRNLRSNSHWNTPADIVRACASQYREDLWRDQDFYVEVWIEKDALVGVLESVCPKNDVPYFSCRGYTSQSEMWSAAMRLNKAARVGTYGTRKPVVIHLGDHDPSGVDMSRDIKDRLNKFSNAVFSEPPEFDNDWEPCEIEVRRIALTKVQVDHFQPPPNPAKMLDSRAKDYVALYGMESWELDALEPRTLIKLIQKEIDDCRDDERWEKSVEKQDAGRRELVIAANRMDDRPLLETLKELRRNTNKAYDKAKKGSREEGEKVGWLGAIQQIMGMEKRYLPKGESDDVE